MFQKILFPWTLVLSRILFPSPCLQCGLLGDPLCSACFQKLKFAAHKRILSDLEGSLEVVSPYFYEEDSLLSKLIYPFKYSHQENIFRIFLPGLSEALRLLKTDLEDLVFVPVPLHRKRLFERGYNQAELLASALAKEWGGIILPLLIRVKDTGFQSHLLRKGDRKENMKGAFEVHGLIPKNGQIVLVDDIVSSGSTLLGCAKALRRAGANFLSAITLADREKKTKNFRN